VTRTCYKTLPLLESSCVAGIPPRDAANVRGMKGIVNKTAF
jgi:hypothetical protein